MEIEDQACIREIIGDISLPDMYLVRQKFLHDEIKDVPSFLRHKLLSSHLGDRIKPGMTVVMTGSSREIDNMPVVLREISRFVKAHGAQPYIIPAMGSHGGATDEGQKQLLEGYGITEEFCECPIYSSMKTDLVGHMTCGDEVRMDAFAHHADAIIVVGRIKGHTAFRGRYESGIAKMIAIGMGKRAGADSLHKYGFGELAKRLPEYSKIVFNHCNIIFAVGLIENEYDRTCRIEVIPAEDIYDKEPELLQYAKTRMPRLVIPETDVLMVREIGKNFSGSGMDPNVTGTFGTPFASGGIKKQRTVVLDISEESHGNHLGLGMADVTTKRAFEKIKTNGCYVNMLTSTVVKVGKIPMVMEDDKLALQAAIKTLTFVDKENPRIVYIKNTLSLDKILISRALYQEAVKHPEIEVIEGPRQLKFDKQGKLLDFD